MKTRIAILILLSFHLSNYAQECLPDGIVFERQGQIDSFSTNYPNCTTIIGNVEFEFDVQELNGLSQIERIEGNLTTNSCRMTENFEGLDNLIYVGGSVELFNCNNISSFSGFEALEYIGGDLRIVNTSSTQIQNYFGFSNLERIDGDLKLWCNHDSTLEGFDNLRFIGGSLGMLFGNIQSLSDDDHTTPLPFPKLDTIYGILAIQQLPNLTSISAISQLEYLGGMTMTQCPNVKVLNLGYIEKFYGGLTLKYNSKLTDIGAIQNNIGSTELTSLAIMDHPLLTVCDYEPICQYLATGSEAEIEDNSAGCNSASEVNSLCTGIFPECPEGDVLILEQNDLTEFLQNYPNCTEINGDLIIDDDADFDPQHSDRIIYDFTALQNIERVNGDFRILSITSPYILNTQGSTELPKLKYIGGAFELQTRITNFTLLSKVEFVKSIEINSAFRLFNLDSLKVDVLDHLIIMDSNFDSIPYFGNLKEIKGDFTIRDTNLKDLDIFNRIESVGGNFVLSENSKLENIHSLSNLRDLGKDLVVFANDTLYNLSGLDSLHTFNGSLRVVGNRNLTSLQGLSSLYSLKDVVISINGSLQNLKGLQALKGAEELVVADNQNLMTLDGLENIVSLKSLRLDNNPNLETTTSFEKLNLIDGSLSIHDCWKLNNLDGFFNLKELRGNLSLLRNDSLSTLAGLDSLLIIDGRISFNWMKQLDDISALSNVDGSKVDRVEIRHNSLLSNCSIESICHFLNISDDYLIGSNAESCMDVEEIKAGCVGFLDTDGDGFVANDDCDDTNPDIYPGAEEVPNNAIDEDCDGEDLIISSTNQIDMKLAISPNPFDDSFSIEIGGDGVYAASVYDSTGLLIRAFTQIEQMKHVDMTNFSSGLYFIEVKDKQGRKIIRKIVKQ